MSNGKGDSSNVRLLLGIITVLFTSGVLFLVNGVVSKLDEIDKRVAMSESGIAVMNKSLMLLDEMMKEMKKDRDDRTAKLNEMSMKIGNIEAKMVTLDEKYKLVYDKALLIVQKLSVANYGEIK